MMIPTTRLEDCVVSQWATVCQGKLDDQDAIVACRQLELSYDRREFIGRFEMYLVSE